MGHEHVMPETITPPRGRARPLGCLIDVVAVIALTIVALFLVTTFVAQPYQVEQDSMYPTLQEGQHVLVDKLTPRFDSYSRGDIVIFRPVKRSDCSSSEATPLPGSAPYIKRVIGEPGDVIELRDGDVYVNGARLAEPYEDSPLTGPPNTRWVVPQGRLFVMGDNRPESMDSRSDQVGPICINDVIGRVVLRVWPLNKLAIIQAPSYPTVPNAPSATSGEATLVP